MPKKEGLRFVRLMMVLSSLMPLFALWAVRGMQPLPDTWLLVGTALLIVVPNALLLARYLLARKHGDMRTLAINRADDHRDHLLVYLFAMLIPLFDANVGRTRDTIATMLAFAFVVFLFWHLNLHYMNVVFAVAGFRVFTINTPGSPEPIVLLTKRSIIESGIKIHAYRLSNTVFIETREQQ